MTIDYRNRLLSLQVLKAFACIGIIICHTNVCLFFGKSGVSIFLVLSGFLFTYNYFNSEIELSLKSSISFSLKRISRLYPLYICTLIALLPLNGLFNQTLYSNIKSLLIHIFLLQSLSADMYTIYTLDRVLWYLSSIMFIYMLIPFSLKVLQRIKSKLTLSIICIILVSIQILLDYLNLPYIYLYTCPLSRFIDVFVGCTLGYIYLHKKTNINNNLKHIKYTIYESIAIASAIITYYLFANGKVGAVYPFLPSTLLLIYSFSINQGYISYFLTNKFFIYLGDLSNYAYLIHMVIIRYLIVFFKHVFHTELNIIVLNVLSLILTFLCSEIWKRLIVYYRKYSKNMS